MDDTDLVAIILFFYYEEENLTFANFLEPIDFIGKYNLFCIA